jgi:hypothetical protein
MQEIREMFERSERKKRDLVEAELVLMIDEGDALKGNAFGDGAAPSDEVLSWRESVITFIDFALGDLERQRFLEMEPTAPDIEGTINAILNWLRQRRDDPAAWETRARGLNGTELDAAIEVRRGKQPKTLADRLDALMREGIDLLDELMAPAQAEETGEGVWALEFGDAPAEWWDKADAFYKRIKNLLIAEHPALLSDFERGYNERLRIEREREEDAPQRPDSRSQAQKILDFATDTQRTPARIVEACLEGLSHARKSI